jgi:hypothetical protein
MRAQRLNTIKKKRTIKRARVSANSAYFTLLSEIKDKTGATSKSNTVANFKYLDRVPFFIPGNCLIIAWFIMFIYPFLLFAIYGNPR